MAMFSIEIVETLSKVVEVKADSLEDAMFLVEEMYHNDELELDYNDKETTEFKEYPYPRFQEDFSMDLNYTRNSDRLSVKSGNKIDSEHSCKNVEELKLIISESIEKMERDSSEKQTRMATNQNEKNEER